MDINNFITSFKNDYDQTIKRLEHNLTRLNHTAHEHWETPLFTATTANDLESVKYILAGEADINEGHSLGMTPLYVAAENGYERIVRYLIQKGADINRPAFGTSPLYAAAIHGHKAVVESLVEAGCDLEATDEKGATALMMAIAYAGDDIVRLLIDSGANVNAKDNRRLTPLCLAVFRERKDIVEYLIKKGADTNTDLHKGVTVIQLIPFIKNLEILKCLVDLGANIKATEGRDGVFRSAIIEGQAAMVQYLANHGADLNEVYQDGYTPLFVAIKTKNKEIVRILLEAGADSNRRIKMGDTSFIPLLMAIIEEQLPIIKLLIEYSANPNLFCGEMSPFTLSMAGDKRIFSYLLKHGGDIHKINEDGNTALFYAAGGNDIALVEQLIKLGTDVNAQNHKGVTPLMNACTRKDAAMVNLLIKHGADVNLNHTGALFTAVLKGSISIVGELLKHGADITTLGHVNKKGAIFIPAAMSGNIEMFRYLLKHAPQQLLKELDQGSLVFIASHYKHFELADFLQKKLNYEVMLLDFCRSASEFTSEDCGIPFNGNPKEYLVDLTLKLHVEPSLRKNKIINEAFLELQANFPEVYNALDKKLKECPQTLSDTQIRKIKKSLSRLFEPY